MSRPIRTVEPLSIPIPDGTRLAARAWLPQDAEANPVPAILEYIPYRWRDGTRSRDEAMHGWFAQEGYAAVRVDLPGSGESEGLLGDEGDDVSDVIGNGLAEPQPGSHAATYSAARMSFR